MRMNIRTDFIDKPVLLYMILRICQADHKHDGRGKIRETLISAGFAGRDEEKFFLGRSGKFRKRTGREVFERQLLREVL